MISGPPSAGWTLNTRGAGAVLEIQGDWIAKDATLPSFPAIALAGNSSLSMAVAGLGKWDSALIEFLWDVKRITAEAGCRVDWGGLPEAAQKLLALLPSRVDPETLPKRVGFAPLHWLGGRSIGVLTALGAVMMLLGETVRGGGAALRGRAKLRGVDILADIRAAGPAALPIVSVVNVLVGSILAFVGAAQLRKFAADIYVANLVGLAVVREMASVMTAIVMAGRTGGAYAARIATMQGNEEIDALQVFGIPVSEYVVLPSILALVVTMPLLYLYGCLLGVMGGTAVAMLMLSVTGTAYLHQTFAAVSLGQFVFGFIKSIAFAALIAVTSCRIGLQAGRSAADVGQAATNAVVVGIVGVIALDAVFAVLAEAVGF